jgi:SPP1 family predicted phage head-tail adaptor
MRSRLTLRSTLFAIVSTQLVSQSLKSFAKVRSKGGREFWKVQQVNADVSHVWNCQYSKALAESTPAMRLIHDGVTYEILSVIDIDLAHQEVEIQTKRAV